MWYSEINLIFAYNINDVNKIIKINNQFNNEIKIPKDNFYQIFMVKTKKNNYYIINGSVAIPGFLY